MCAERLVVSVELGDSEKIEAKVLSGRGKPRAFYSGNQKILEKFREAAQELVNTPSPLVYISPQSVVFSVLLVNDDDNKCPNLKLSEKNFIQRLEFASALYKKLLDCNFEIGRAKLLLQDISYDFETKDLKFSFPPFPTEENPAKVDPAGCLEEILFDVDSEEILVKLVEKEIADPVGREFWLSSFGGTFTVDETKFWDKFVLFYSSDSDRISSKLKEYFRDYRSGNVTVYDFDVTMAYLGPSKRDDNGAWVDATCKLLDQSWFFGHSNDYIARRNLENGTQKWVVRFSRTNRPNWAVMYKTGPPENEIRTVLLTKDPETGALVFNADGQNHKAKDGFALVEKLNEIIN